MPGDVPVATVGVGSGGARNAGLLAVQILALADAALQENSSPSGTSWSRRSTRRTPPCKTSDRQQEKCREAALPNGESESTSNPVTMKNLETLRWVGGVDGHLRLIDQTLLPVEFVEIDCRDVEAVWEAIRTLRVRGAPAIGIAAAYGVCVGVQTAAERRRGRLLPPPGRSDRAIWPAAGRRRSTCSGPWIA